MLFQFKQRNFIKNMENMRWSGSACYELFYNTYEKTSKKLYGEAQP